MAEISYEYIKVTGDLVYFGISERVNVTLNSLPIITLSDHIAFAIECKKFTNHLIYQIYDYFSDELVLGRYCSER